MKLSCYLCWRKLILISVVLTEELHLVLLMESNGLNLSNNMTLNLSIYFKCSESTVSC